MTPERMKEIIDDLLRFALDIVDAQAVIEYLESLGYSDNELESMGLI